MLLKIALNGARPKSENENIPQSLDEIKREVRLIYKAGFNVFHIHCYSESGKESLNAEDVNALVSSVKKISSDIQVGISTGDWIEPDPGKRINNIKNWRYNPDFASVNMIEDDSVKVSKALVEKGILVEAGLNEAKAAEIFVRNNLVEGCCRILIEPEDENIEKAINTVNEIEKILDSGKVRNNRLLHGFNSTAWKLLREAKKRGYDSRIGMEDTTYLENGRKVKNNLELISHATIIINSD